MQAIIEDCFVILSLYVTNHFLHAIIQLCIVLCTCKSEKKRIITTQTGILV